MRNKKKKTARLIEFALLNHCSISLLSISFNLPEKAVKAILGKRGIKK